ncbi:MAG: transposase [Candidatus Fermentibacteraceae bacterium]|nr:transposase [Candidatus Fermentibacteraceae bacterium]MBN2608353.1 transposase [Candidatus Fermentibacteraceae bacterium]
MARMLRPDWEGALHHIMVRGIDGRTVFSGESDKEDLVHRLEKLVVLNEVEIYAWAIMPNHLHLLLLRTGKLPVYRFMHRLLTGYAVAFNLRNNRSGHVFQGRFKSILAQEELYFVRLLRYIHRNPLKGGVVKDTMELENYRWCGHGSILGIHCYPWHNRSFVLSKFGDDLEEQISKYSKVVIAETDDKMADVFLCGTFMLGKDGISPASTAGSLWPSFCRVLGNRDFALKTLGRLKRNGAEHIRERMESHRQIENLFDWVEKKLGFTRHMIQGEARSPSLSDARALVAWVSTRRLGLSQSDCMRILRMSRNGVREAIRRGEILVSKSHFIRENSIW